MKKYSAKLLALAVSSAVFSAGVAAEEPASLVDAIKQGDATLSFRFRVEDVQQDAEPDDLDATATTLRTRLTFTTAAYQGWSGGIEFDHVEEILDVDYNSGPAGPSVPGKATVLDPEGTDLNQAWVAYKAGDTLIKAGRQRILLDNQRFVGGVGWRQNEQTYDGLSVTNKSVENLEFFYAYIDNVNRIFGDEAAIGDHNNNTHLINAKYSFGEVGSLTGYKYIIDNDDALAYSNDTMGLRFTGAQAGFSYTAEYARQSDAGDSPADYSANYMLLEAGYKFEPVAISAGYEVLGADGSNGQFITPLATLHAFQGWSDKFLGGGTGNIAGGIKDVYGKVSGKIGPVTAALVYHQLSSDDSDVSGMDDLGSELGLVLKGKAGPVGLLFKYADYSADDFATDTSKLWLMGTISF